MSRRILCFVLYGLAVLIGLPPLFYGIENYRGLYAWHNYKTAAVARGVTLDWAAFTPAPVPDDQNFFKAPDMESWFGKRGTNHLTEHLYFKDSRPVAPAPTNRLVAKITVVPTSTNVFPGDADFIFEYTFPSLTVATKNSITTATEREVIPLIMMDGVPLRDAVKNLAAQMKINYRFDPAILSEWEKPTGQSSSEPEITFRWEKVTAWEALAWVLYKNGLALLPEDDSGIARIVKLDAEAASMQVSSFTKNQLGELLADAWFAGSDGKPLQHLNGSTGIELTTGAISSNKIIRIIVRTDSPFSYREITKAFPSDPLDVGSWNGGAVEVKPDGSGYGVYLSFLRQVDSATYLAWSDQFTNEFASLRAGLKRTSARVEGDYDDVVSPPGANFATVRVVAQMLGQRAQCHLLLDQPEAALRELTLLRQLASMLENNRPTTLISAMISSAVSGLYVDVVGTGLRLHAWRESQLAVLQSQLAGINLLPQLRNGLKYETATQSRMAEKVSSRDLAEMQIKYRYLPDGAKYKDSAYLYLRLAPRGWIYQNVARVSDVQQNLFDTIDVTNQLVFPRRVDEQVRTLTKNARRISPYTYYAALMIPDFSRAIQWTTKNQTIANQAQIVCALERHRLAHGRYPKSLDPLKTEFGLQPPADLIGGEPLHYRVEDGQFILYSVGWKGRDDGGLSDPKGEYGGDFSQYDWVWQNDLHPTR